MYWMAVLLLAGSVAAIGIAILTRRRIARRARLRGICKALDLEMSGDCASGFHDGFDYELRQDWSGAARDSGPSLRITIPGAAVLEFVMIAAGQRPDDTKEMIGTGDVDFDRAVRIEDGDSEKVSEFFGNSTRRRAVRKLFELGADSIRASGTGLEVRLPHGEWTNDGNPGFISTAVSYLGDLARGCTEALPSRVATSHHRGSGRAKILVPIALAMSGAAAFVWSALHFPPIEVEELALLGITSGVVLLAPWLILVGRARFFRRETIRVTLLSSLAFPIAGVGMCSLMNGYSDTGTLAVRTATITGKSRLCLVRCTAHAVQVRSWREDAPQARIPVTRQIYDRAQPGRMLLVVSKPGRLGIEWVLESKLK